MKTKPVRAPKFPESVLYMYGTTKVNSLVTPAFEMTPMACVFNRSRYVDISAVMTQATEDIVKSCQAMSTFLFLD